MTLQTDLPATATSGTGEGRASRTWRRTGNARVVTPALVGLPTSYGSCKRHVDNGFMAIPSHDGRRSRDPSP